MSEPTAHIDLQQALARLTGSQADRSVELFRHGTLQVKLYAPRGHDPQQLHTRDEVYVVARGSGVFYDGERRRRFEPGVRPQTLYDLLAPAYGRVEGWIAMRLSTLVRVVGP